jgi:hypothetical protein
MQKRCTTVRSFIDFIGIFAEGFSKNLPDALPTANSDPPYGPQTLQHLTVGLGSVKTPLKLRTGSVDTTNAVETREGFEA